MQVAQGKTFTGLLGTNRRDSSALRIPPATTARCPRVDEMTTDQQALADNKYVALTTFRKTGEAVSSPVWIIGLDDGSFGFWTSSGSGKAKRLAHTSRVIVQPSDARGKPTEGSTVTEATAEKVTSGPAFDEVKRKIKAKYGLFTHVTKLLGTIGGIVKRNRIPYGDVVVVITPT